MPTGIMLGISLMQGSEGDGTKVRVKEGQHVYRDFYDSLLEAKKVV